jgi:hypothetical protein
MRIFVATSDLSTGALNVRRITGVMETFLKLKPVALLSRDACNSWKTGFGGVATSFFLQEEKPNKQLTTKTKNTFFIITKITKGCFATALSLK